MSVGQIRIMKCWGALFQPRGPPLALFYGHFKAPIDSKWQYLTLSSLSSHKWVEYWVNMIEHCISHSRGSVRALSAPRNCQFGAPEPPKNGHLWPFFGQKRSFWGVLGPPNDISMWSKRPKLTPPDVENNVQPCSPNVQPIWGRWDYLWPPLAILDQKKP